MKKYFIIPILLLAFAFANVNAQYVTGTSAQLIKVTTGFDANNPIKWYNTAGTNVYTLWTANTGTATLDTFATQVFPLDQEGMDFSFNAGYLDTVACNFYYQFVDGYPFKMTSGFQDTTQGYFIPGGQGLSALQDSINTVLRTGAKNGANIHIGLQEFSGQTQTTVGVFVGNILQGTSRDSIRTVTYTVNPNLGHWGVQFVIVTYSSKQNDRTNTMILKQCSLRRWRK
jgi:hypothetical protein